MIFTKSERKWILETIRYDVINSSYRVLRESGIPIRNIKIDLKNERNLLENYFRDVSLREAKGFMGGVSIVFKTIFGIFKAIYTVVTGFIKAAVTVGVSVPVFKLAKDALEHSKYAAKEFVPFVKGVKSIKIPYTDKEIPFGLWKDSLKNQVEAGGKGAKASTSLFVKSLKKDLNINDETFKKILKIAGPISNLIGKAAVLCKHILMKIGMSESLATSIAPYALVGATIAGMAIIVKLFKMLLARLWKMIAVWKKNDKKKPENIDEEGKKMASVSLKMQQQAASKIKDPEVKKKVDKVLSKRKKMLASA